MTTSVTATQGLAVLCPSELQKILAIVGRNQSAMEATLEDCNWAYLLDLWISSYYSPNIYPPACTSIKTIDRGHIVPVYLAVPTSGGYPIDIHWADSYQEAVLHFQKHGYTVQE